MLLEKKDTKTNQVYQSTQS